MGRFKNATFVLQGYVRLPSRILHLSMSSNRIHNKKGPTTKNGTETELLHYRRPMCNFTFVCDLATLSGVSSADIVGDSLDPTQHFQHSPCPMSLKDTPWHYRDICRGRRGPGLGGRKYMHCISLTHTYSLETVRPQILARKATTRAAPPSPMYSLAKTRAAPPSPMYSLAKTVSVRRSGYARKINTTRQIIILA